MGTLLLGGTSRGVVGYPRDVPLDAPLDVPLDVASDVPQDQVTAIRVEVPDILENCKSFAPWAADATRMARAKKNTTNRCEGGGQKRPMRRSTSDLMMPRAASTELSSCAVMWRASVGDGSFWSAVRVVCLCWRCHVLIGSTGVAGKKEIGGPRWDNHMMKAQRRVHACIPGTWYLVRRMVSDTAVCVK